jgi:Mg-chelatase subunit ChlI
MIGKPGKITEKQPIMTMADQFRSVPRILLDTVNATQIVRKKEKITKKMTVENVTISSQRLTLPGSLRPRFGFLRNRARYAVSMSVGMC